MARGRKTGNATEERACEDLKKEGFDVWMPPYARFGKTGKFRGNDVFDIFDIIATNDKLIRFIQVKTESQWRSEVIDAISKCRIPKGKQFKKEYWVLWTKTNKWEKREIV